MRSKRLLVLARDERLVEAMRRGNEAAFEVAFERHGPGILGFCRHMLGSAEEAEDAAQHSFAAAFRSLQRDDDRELAFKPWLYAIARNRCLSVLRSRREQVPLDSDVATAGLAEHVERRAELRELLADLGDLPEDQRAALLLSELGSLSHSQVAAVLGCEPAKVKALVFRARTGLIQRRKARDVPCEKIREQLANLRGRDVAQKRAALPPPRLFRLPGLSRAGETAAPDARRGPAGRTVARLEGERPRQRRLRGRFDRRRARRGDRRSR